MQRRRALRWLVGSAGGLALYGCGGGDDGIQRQGDNVRLAQMDASPTTFDPAADFSATANPNGVWSYGWSTELGSSFMLDAVRGDTFLGTSDFHWWAGENITDADPGHFPLVGHNSTGALFDSAGLIVPAGQLTLHPGPNGEYAVLRFTASVAGSYSISAKFLRLDVGCGTTTDVHVLSGGRSVFDGVVNNACAEVSMQSVKTLAASDTIDFAVGFGTGSYFCDTTGLNATITLMS
jgi:hypothetical protein